ncbi:MAG TPA: hypothetical protein VMV69_23950 [Pirellulales bacterium]|nr:hypothetical protein [Pirellulales bacterium]
MSFDDLRQRAAVVREIALEAVLLCRGAERDPRDRSKWQTEQGPLSVTGKKFMSWRWGRGGGGAINLVMHLAAVAFRAAVEWLEQRLAVGPIGGGQSPHPLFDAPFLDSARLSESIENRFEPGSAGAVVDFVKELPLVGLRANFNGAINMLVTKRIAFAPNVKCTPRSA